jgi:hypothetical protein
VSPPQAREARQAVSRKERWCQQGQLPESNYASGSTESHVGTAVLRIGKLHGSSIVRVAADHNKRSASYRHRHNHAPIDPRLSQRNYCLAGPPTALEVAELAKSLMADAGVLSLRNDAVRAVEVLICLTSVPSSSMLWLGY